MPTPNFFWNTPNLPAPNNVPADLLSLATQIDASLKIVAAMMPLKIAVGSYSLTIPGGTSGSTGSGGAFRFDSGIGRFDFTAPPRVFLQVAAPAAGSPKLNLVVAQSSVTTVAATIHIYSGDGTTISGGQAISWLAIGV